jgi:hypothetical protein
MNSPSLRHVSSWTFLDSNTCSANFCGRAFQVIDELDRMRACAECSSQGRETRRGRETVGGCVIGPILLAIQVDGGHHVPHIGG